MIVSSADARMGMAKTLGPVRLLRGTGNLPCANISDMVYPYSPNYEFTMLLKHTGARTQAIP